MKNVVTVMLAVGLVGVLVVNGQADDQSAKSGLVIEQQEIDVGAVKAGQEAVATFVFRNTGETPVRILQAKPG